MVLCALQLNNPSARNPLREVADCISRKVQLDGVDLFDRFAFVGVLWAVALNLLVNRRRQHEECKYWNANMGILWLLHSSADRRMDEWRSCVSAHRSVPFYGEQVP